ncbi:hypothetical protein CYMTET_5231 [Cymbomonas tetramitiformis]|uniref:AP2/ERF domain-containing protein n=1 Tax=Cymbomonas tetramitiformis TaxID=36881 RepID=A0AAE0LJP0_9CHLO|nr:hypothetical protein CYMTET_5231 [Cymbomonas tetramitiformis]
MGPSQALSLPGASGDGDGSPSSSAPRKHPAAHGGLASLPTVPQPTLGSAGVGNHEPKVRGAGAEGSLLRQASGSDASRSREGRASSQYRGVSWVRTYRKWRAYIYAGPGMAYRHLGQYDDEVTAAEAYDRASREVHGSDTSKVNFSSAHPSARTSKYLGVCWLKRDQAWRAVIRPAPGAVQRYLGNFKDEESAAEAYDRASREVHGSDTTKVNFPLPSQQARRAQLVVRSTAHSAQADHARTLARASRYSGVSWFKQTRKWYAYVTINGCKKHLGYFVDEETAAEAYDRASRELHGADTTKVNFALPGQQARRAQLVVRSTANSAQADHMRTLARKSSYLGVSWHKASRKWNAKIGINGSNKHLGYFDEEKRAAEAYDRASRELRGTDTSKVNFPLPYACSEPPGPDVAGGGASRLHRAALPAPGSGAASKQAVARRVVAASKAAAQAQRPGARPPQWQAQGDGARRPDPRQRALPHEGLRAVAGARGRGEAGGAGTSARVALRVRRRRGQRSAQADHMHTAARTSSYLGVSWNKKSRKWNPKIGINGTQQHLGLFDEEERAAEAYDRASRELHGADTAKVNFPLPAKVRRSSSQYRGVSLRGATWAAYIWNGVNTKDLGSFDEEESAAEAYDRASRELHGADTTKVNFPLPDKEEATGASEPIGNHDRSVIARQPAADKQTVKGEGQAEGLGQEGGPFVGQRVMCWWDKYGWCAGVIASYDKATKEHEIVYDDGEWEMVTLPDDTIRFVEPICDNLQNDRARRELHGADTTKVDHARTTAQTSSYWGVSWHKQSSRWRAYITINGTQKHLGSFDVEERAAQAHDRAIRELRGADTAKVNFPLPDQQVRRAQLGVTSTAHSAQADRARTSARTSSYLGVSWHKKSRKWNAYIHTLDGCKKYLGSFDEEETAAEAYDRASRELRGADTTKVNFPLPYACSELPGPDVAGGGASRLHRAALPAPGSGAASKQAAARRVVAASKAAALRRSAQAQAAPCVAAPGVAPGRPDPPKVRRSSSQYRDVTFQKRESRWVARIGFGGRDKHLGSFDVAERAAEAYGRSSRELHGADTTKVNFPLPGQQARGAQLVVRSTAHSAQVDHARTMARTSSYLGVSWNKQSRKWNPKIRINGTQKHLGYFDEEETAAEAYDRASRKLHGTDTTKVNFPLPYARSELPGAAMAGGGASRLHRAVRTKDSLLNATVDITTPLTAVDEVITRELHAHENREPRGADGKVSETRLSEMNAAVEGTVAVGPAGSGTPKCGSGGMQGVQKVGCLPASQNADDEHMHAGARAAVGWERGGTGHRPGVVWEEQRKRWRVEHTMDSCCFHVGYFAEEERAAEAYDRASQELHGADTTKVNFPGLPCRRADKEEATGASEPIGNHDRSVIARQPAADKQTVKGEGQAEGLGQEGGPFVGQRVMCWWDKYGWCAGVIASYDKATKEHEIVYDDGEWEMVTLPDDTIRFVEPICDNLQNDRARRELHGADTTKLGAGRRIHVHGNPAPRGGLGARCGGGAGERGGGRSWHKRARGAEGEAEARAAKVRRSSSQYRDVTFQKRESRWVARIGIGGRDKHLGSFDDEERAAEAYGRSSQELHGADTTKVNFPLPGQQARNAQLVVGSTANSPQADHMRTMARTSRYLGVSWNKKSRKWNPKIGINGTQKHLGYFAEEERAAEAYDRASRELHGADTTKVNFPGSPCQRADEKEATGASEPIGNHDRSVIARQPAADKQTVKEEGQAEGLGQEGGPFVGQRVMCWWDKYGWCAGVIASYDKATKEHEIVYDDGEWEMVTLPDDTIRFVEPICDNLQNDISQHTKQHHKLYKGIHSQ